MPQNRNKNRVAGNRLGAIQERIDHPPEAIRPLFEHELRRYPELVPFYRADINDLLSSPPKPLSPASRRLLKDSLPILGLPSYRLITHDRGEHDGVRVPPMTPFNIRSMRVVHPYSPAGAAAAEIRERGYWPNGCAFPLILTLPYTASNPVIPLRVSEIEAGDWCHFWRGVHRDITGKDIEGSVGYLSSVLEHTAPEVVAWVHEDPAVNVPDTRIDPDIRAELDRLTASEPGAPPMGAGRRWRIFPHPEVLESRVLGLYGSPNTTENGSPCFGTDALIDSLPGLGAYALSDRGVVYRVFSDAGQRNRNVRTGEALPYPLKPTPVMTPHARRRIKKHGDVAYQEEIRYVGTWQLRLRSSFGDGGSLGVTLSKLYDAVWMGQRHPWDCHVQDEALGLSFEHFFDGSAWDPSTSHGYPGGEKAYADTLARSFRKLAKDPLDPTMPDTHRRRAFAASDTPLDTQS